MMTAAPFVRRRAETWLREQLADGVPHPSSQLLEAASRLGIAERTLRRARQRIGATTAKQYALNAAGVRRLQAHVWQLASDDEEHDDAKIAAALGFQPWDIIWRRSEP